jgi:predicted nuclease of predicted toxin-antitoxin system
MNLLLDQNLSYRLCNVLAVDFGNVAHVRELGLGGVDDEELWRFARDNGFALVSKDSDFFHRSLVRGYPPKVIFLRVGNCSTKSIAELLTHQKEIIKGFIANPVESLLILR